MSGGPRLGPGWGLAVRPGCRLGPPKDLKSLVQAAHERGRWRSRTRSIIASALRGIVSTIKANRPFRQRDRRIDFARPDHRASLSNKRSLGIWRIKGYRRPDPGDPGPAHPTPHRQTRSPTRDGSPPSSRGPGPSVRTRCPGSSSKPSAARAGQVGCRHPYPAALPGTAIDERTDKSKPSPPVAGDVAAEADSG